MLFSEKVLVMPGYRLHARGGLFASGGFLVLAVGYLLWHDLWRGYWSAEGILRLLALLVIGFVSAIFSDVDTKSRAQTWIYRLLLGFDAVLLYRHQYRQAALLGFLAMLPLISRHRGWTHSWLAALVLPALIFGPEIVQNEADRLFWTFCYLVALVGYGTHLVLDKQWGWFTVKRRKGSKRAGGKVSR